MPQEVRKIADHMVRERSAAARPHNEKARGVARHGRMKGNAVFGQVEIEVGRTHGLPFRSERTRQGAYRSGLYIVLPHRY
jgi:hypothetical protein